MPTDVEIDRALNALNVTLNDQRPDGLDVERLQQIVTGALGGEREIEVRPDGAGAAALHDHEGRRLGTVRDEGGGRFSVSRDIGATGSHVAVPPDE